MPMLVKERCCCGCSISVGSRMLAALSGITALTAIFLSFFYYSGVWIMLAEILYSFACVCAAALVFRAVRSGRAILMAPIMLVSIINFVGLVIVFIVAMLTAFGVQTYIYSNVKYMYDHNIYFQQTIDLIGDNTDELLAAYARTLGWYGASFSFLCCIFAVWVFIVHLDCFRTLKEKQSHYPTAQYHGNDNITVPIYLTYPAPAYDAAVSSPTGEPPAPAYPGAPHDSPQGLPFDLPPSYTNEAVTTADETPVKVPLP